MPSRIIMHRPPLLTMNQAPLMNGSIKTKDPYAIGLYRYLLQFPDYPETWLGSFELSCLLFRDPMKEKPAALILDAINREKEQAFPGDFFQQLHIARAALAVAEYSADRSILKRLSDWCNWTEINWDQIICQSRLRIAPADYMEFLVRFYQMTGLKAILRLCTRLRSSAMDWTSVLHAYGKHKNQEKTAETFFEEKFLNNELDENDFETRQRIIAHAEILADGMRYTALSALFSGNGQELTAGQTGWQIIRKNNYSICGGTSGTPFLSGTGSDQYISLTTLSAWADSFAAQLVLADSKWALDEMIRIMMNGFSFAVYNNPIQIQQAVNCPDYHAIQPVNQNVSNQEIHAISRAAHTLSLFYRYAVTLGKTQIRINYLLPGQYILHRGKIRLLIQEDNLQVKRMDDSDLRFLFYCAATETRKIQISINGKEYSCNQTDQSVISIAEGRYYSFEEKIQTDSVIWFTEQPCLIEENTHHHGKCWFFSNYLLAVPADPDNWKLAATASPMVENGRSIFGLFTYITNWKEKDGLPEDLPILPKAGDEIKKIEMKPYFQNTNRISMFPRTADL